jgi:hypothetical protein
MLWGAGYDVDYHRYDPARIAAALDGAAGEVVELRRRA